MRPFEVKTFALTLKKEETRGLPAQLEAIYLPCNIAVDAIPAELYPDVIKSGGIIFITQKESNNAMACRGQTIPLPRDAKRVHLLMCSLAGDTRAVFGAGEAPVELTVQDAFEAVGAWDLVGLGETGRIKRAPLAWNATHTHSKGGDVPAKHFYLFKYSVDLNGAHAITMPQDENIAVFAVTADFEAGTFIPGASLYDALEPRPFDYEISPEDMKKARPTRLERLLDRIVRRDRLITVSLPNVSGVFSVGDIYSVVRQFTQKRKAKRP